MIKFIKILKFLYLSIKTHYQCLKAVDEDLKNLQFSVDHDEQWRIFDSWKESDKDPKISRVYGGKLRQKLDL